MSLTFQITNYLTGTNSTSVAIGDLNGDGKLDLAVTNIGVLDPLGEFTSPGTVSVLLGNVNGNPDAVAMGDLNGDGRLDLAVANAGSNTVSVLLGNGAGGFQAQTQYATGTNPDSVAIGDLNGDGRLDLAVANHNSNTGFAGQCRRRLPAANPVPGRARA
jgi:uncharacterized protein (DUF2141 family)